VSFGFSFPWLNGFGLKQGEGHSGPNLLMIFLEVSEAISINTYLHTTYIAFRIFCYFIMKEQALPMSWSLISKTSSHDLNATLLDIISKSKYRSNASWCTSLEKGLKTKN